MEIVPVEENLYIETRIRPTDIAFLKPGLHAIVKLSAYDSGIYGWLDAELVQISPDTLRDDFKKDDFVKIDLTMLTEIPLNSARKATLVTPHPTDSYKFVMGASYDKLVILDPEKFWSGSKYLVVVVDEKR